MLNIFLKMHQVCYTTHMRGGYPPMGVPYQNKSIVPQKRCFRYYVYFISNNISAINAKKAMRLSIVSPSL